MASIRSKDTKPELLIRKALHRLGFRYRTHYKKLPGKPDIVFPKYGAIILVNGCFWHGHHCHLANPSRKLSEKWAQKLAKNQVRDSKNLKLYKKLGWRVLVIWECAVIGKTKWELEELISAASNWLKFGDKDAVITGR